MTQRLVDHLRDNSGLNISDVAHSLQIGREPFEHRRIVAARDIPDAIDVLKMNDPQRIITGKSNAAPPSIVFMFPGGGAQYPDMGRELYETQAVYRDAVDECLRLLAPHVDVDLKRLMFSKNRVHSFDHSFWISAM